MSVEVVGSLACFLAGSNQLAVFPLLCWVNLEVEAATKLCHKSRLASTRIRILMPIKAIRPRPRALPRPLGQAVAGNWFLVSPFKAVNLCCLCSFAPFPFPFVIWTGANLCLCHRVHRVTRARGEPELVYLFTAHVYLFLPSSCPSRCVCLCPSLSVYLSVSVSLSVCVCVFVVAAWPTTTRKTPPSRVVSSGEFRWGEVVVDITEVLVALPQTGLPLSHSLALPANYPALSLSFLLTLSLSLSVPAHARLAWPRRQRDKTSFSCERIFVARGRRCAQRKNKPLEVNPNPKLESRTSKLESRNDLNGHSKSQRGKKKTRARSVC